MYNMDISIFGFKFNLEILILIGVIYLILVGHLFCGCCKVKSFEGFDSSGNDVSYNNTNNNKKNNSTSKEGFSGANTNYGESADFNVAYLNKVNTSSWDKPDMIVKPGKPLSPAVKEFLNRKPQPVPLPEGQMLMFANTPFKPECCPNTYSTGSGCACMTGEQYNYLILRGGNNVPYSEY